MSDTVPNQPKNEFLAGTGHKRAGCPYRLTRGNYGFFLPTKLFGLVTSGRKLIIDLRTDNLMEAQERIDACCLWIQLATAKKNF